MTDPTPLSARIIARGDTRTDVRSAVANAARRTDTDFEYLLAQARLESGLRPHAKARTSSATGLFQFIESTWLATMKRHGPSLGFGDVASSIQRSGGSYYVADPGARRAILNLRKDPQIASLMAGALAQDNRDAIQPILGREPYATELYMAHFLGAGDAKRFLSELRRDPSQSAPALFPRPASANQSIFYHSSGAPRDLAGVMGLMQGKMRRAIAANDRMPQPRIEPWIEPNMSGIFGDESRGAYPRRASRMIGARANEANPSAPIETPRPPAGRSRYSGPIYNAPPLQLPQLPRVDSLVEGRLDTPAARTRPPMSDLLRNSISLGTASDAAAEQIRRAYANLKALGL